MKMKKVWLMNKLRINRSIMSGKSKFKMIKMNFKFSINSSKINKNNWGIFYQNKMII